MEAWKSCSDSGWAAAIYCQVRLLVGIGVADPE